MSSNTMYVIKRNGTKEKIQFDKVQQRLAKAAKGLDVNTILIAQRVLARIYNGVHTSELDELTAQLAISLITTHYDYGTLAARIAISNHQKNTDASFSAVIEKLSAQIHPKTGEPVSYISAELLATVRANGAAIDARINHERDFLFDYFGFKTLERAYLLKDSKGKVLERPQYIWMRVSLALWPNNLERAFETYDLMSTKAFTHATPTLFNAGTPHQQLSSCFVEGTNVFTMNGVKNIEDVVIGDEVVTHNGHVKKVLQLHKNLLNNRIIYDFKLAGTPTVSVTGNHRLWSISEEQDKWGQKPQWNSVEYLRVGDWVAIPKKKGGETFVLDIKSILDNYTTDGNKVSYHYEYDNNGHVTPYATWKKHFANENTISSSKKGDTINRYWEFDSKMMELIGIWYGDGCIVHGKNSAKQKVLKAINIVSYHTNEKLIKFVTDTLYEKFGVRHVTVSKDKHGMVSMTVNNHYIAFVFEQIFKSGFAGKRLPTFFNKLSYEHITAFLSGLVSSDGCVNSSGSIVVQLTNPELVNQIFHLSRSVGIPLTITIMSSKDKKSTGRMSIPPNIIKDNIKKIYNDDRLTTKIHDHVDWKQTRVIDGVTYMRINYKVPTTKKPEYVYTLGIEDDHSYSVGGFIAENCFLQMMKDDSITGIFKTLEDCAVISKNSGGIGLHCSNIRSKGSLIKGTNGISNGICPMLRVFNSAARYVDQSGKRNGSFAIYLEPWHADVEDFLRLKLPTGTEEERARDLFYALWVPDLFMERVEAGGDWTLFCPAEAPGLADVWGPEFKALYERYEAEGRGKKTIKAQDLWFQVLQTQIETGTPYLLYKDAANAKSNQQNLGTIKSSNLCSEIIEYSSPEETAVCNLASLGLPSFVTIPKGSTRGKFDYDRLRATVKVAIRNLDRVIDINFYPTPETYTSNMRHRPVGLGVQGLADVFALMRHPWESEQAADVNQRIFEHMYYAAVETSAELAQELGTYSSFAGSPASMGRLQPDLWGVKPLTETDNSLDWPALRAKAAAGLRNSLLIAPMPTASTSQILGYNECFEPITSNIYTRRTLAGEFIIVNKYLMRDLIKFGFWSEELKQKIIAQNGSVQGLSEIPPMLQELYKTAWEIKQRTLIDMAAARGAFICQSQSLNLFVSEPTFAKLTSMHFYGWKKGLKTGVYYLRTRAPIMAQKFTVDPDLQAAIAAAKAAESEDNGGCTVCSA